MPLGARRGRSSPPPDAGDFAVILRRVPFPLVAACLRGVDYARF
jgi:hypothetical protein